MCKARGVLWAFTGRDLYRMFIIEYTIGHQKNTRMASAIISQEADLQRKFVIE